MGASQIECRFPGLGKMSVIAILQQLVLRFSYSFQWPPRFSTREARLNNRESAISTFTSSPVRIGVRAKGKPALARSDCTGPWRHLVNNLWGFVGAGNTSELKARDVRYCHVL
jgi:hypothetical protein